MLKYNYQGDNMNNLGEKLKNLRIRNKLTQQKFADLLYVSDKTISSWECNRTIPDINMLFKIAAIFNTSIYNLLYEEFYNDQCLEIELKLKVDKATFNKLMQTLKQEDWPTNVVKHIDTYYSISSKNKLREYVRIRNENGISILGYKRASMPSARIEYETIIDNEQMMDKILTNIGLKKLGKIQKNRTKILYKNKYEFAFDEVKDIGLFIEIEVKKLEYSNIEEIQKLEYLLRDLNLDLNLISDKKYYDYLEEINNVEK